MRAKSSINITCDNGLMAKVHNSDIKYVQDGVSVSNKVLLDTLLVKNCTTIGISTFTALKHSLLGINEHLEGKRNAEIG